MKGFFNAPIYYVYQLQVRFFSFINFTYLIIDKKTKQAAIVDPSWELPKIAFVLQRLNVTLTTILLTHSHFDHVNLVDALMRRYNPQAFLSFREISFYNFKCKNLNPVQHNDVIKLGETEISCLLTPGHTRGSICYLVPGGLFTGDTIFTEGCGLCNTFGGNAAEMFESIQKIRTGINPQVKVFPGHSYGKQSGYSLTYLLKRNISFQFSNKESFINFRMRQSKTNQFQWIGRMKKKFEYGWLSQIRRFAMLPARKIAGSIFYLSIFMTWCSARANNS